MNVTYNTQFKVIELDDGVNYLSMTKKEALEISKEIQEQLSKAALEDLDKDPAYNKGGCL